MNKHDVEVWETVATYGVLFDTETGEQARDVEVQIGRSKAGAWLIRTIDDSGGGDHADDTEYATDESALNAALRLAQAMNELDEFCAHDYNHARLEALAREGEDPTGAVERGCLRSPPTF